MADKSLKKVDAEISTGLSKEDYELAKQTVAKGASDAEFKLLVHVANKYHLDPLLKEIWCIKINASDPAVIMTSRDGYLSIAHRSGQLDGLQSGYILDDKGYLESAWCEIWRKDMTHSFKAQVRFSEYNNPNSPTWKKFPSAMLIKVAETFALKRAFSITGMVTQEEMGTEEVTDSIDGKIVKQAEEFYSEQEKESEGYKKITEKQRAMIFGLLQKLYPNTEKNPNRIEVIKDGYKKVYKRESFNDLSTDEAKIIIDGLLAKQEERSIK